MSKLRFGDLIRCHFQVVRRSANVLMQFFDRTEAVAESGYLSDHVHAFQVLLLLIDTDILGSPFRLDRFPGDALGSDSQASEIQHLKGFPNFFLRTPLPNQTTPLLSKVFSEG